MIKIYPFKALMPSAENAAAIACPPYDVITTEEARAAAEGNPQSFLHVVRSEIDLPIDTDPYDQKVYDKAATNLQAMIALGHLKQDGTAGIYIYKLTFNKRSQTGVVACCDASQYRSDEIKKHEKTRPDKEDDRTRHMTVSSAHAEPVFLTFNDTAAIGNLLVEDTSKAPLVDFKANDDVQHQVWRVANPDAYVSAFAGLDCLYIADGHHRTAGGERAATERQNANPNHTGDEEYNRIMAVMFPASQLQIMAYNRVVKDLNGISEDDFLQKLKTVGDVIPTENPMPLKAGTVCVRLKNGWFELNFPLDSIDQDDPINSLDVALLQSRVLEPILGVGDPRTDSRIGFVGGIRGTEILEDQVISGVVAVAFSMFPTTVAQLLAVSDAGEIMPPKSTWFEPKLRSGLFVHQFEK